MKPRIDLENRTRLETVIPMSVPFIILVDPNDNCNLQCGFCPTGDRELMQNTPGRNHGLMDFELYKKVIDDIGEFEHPIRVLRLYKEGEPLLHPKFPDMVRYAFDSLCSDRIDTTTNATALTPKKSIEIIKAGLTRLNVSIYGMNQKQYMEFSKYKADFQKIADNVRFFYENRERCEVIVKINGDVIPPDDIERFKETFGYISEGGSGISIEHVMECWPQFNLEFKGLKANPNMGIYGQPISEVKVCPYIFYQFSVNSNGTVSACFLDWERKLLVGDAKTQSVKDLWSGPLMNAHRKMMLRGERKDHPVCRNCGQLTHGLPDNIDSYAGELLGKIQ